MKDLKVGDICIITKHKPYSSELAVGEVVRITYIRQDINYTYDSFQCEAVNPKSYRGIAWSMHADAIRLIETADF